MLATLDMLGMTKVYTVTLMVGTNDVSRGEARKVTRLCDKMSCLLEELRIQMGPHPADGMHGPLQHDV